MRALVSIIMPAYNVEKYIVDSIQSVQNQNYPNWELIVINDGSTDDTSRVVRELASGDVRILLCDQDNGGVSCARNRGLSLAKGELIAFLDGDDLWETDFLTELIAVKTEKKASMVYCGYNHFYGTYSRPYRYEYPNGWILPQALLGSVRLHICALIVDRALLEENDIRFTEACAIGEDWEFIMKLLTISEVRSISKNLLLYRVRPGSAITSIWDWRKHIDAINAHKRIIGFIRQKYSPDQAKLNTILPILNESLAYRINRFLWRMIKHGYHDEALKLMNDQELIKYFDNLSTKKLKMIDRFKYSAVVSRNKIWWSIIRLL